MALHVRGAGRAAPPVPGDPPPPEAVTRPLPRGSVVLITLAAAVVVAIGMSAIRGVATPLLLTLILMICVQPVRTALRRRRVPEALATVSVVGVLFGLLAGFVVLVLIAVSQFVNMLPAYQDQLAAIRTDLAAWLESIGFSSSQASGATVALDPHRLTAFLADLLGGAFNLTGALVIVLTFMILMAADAVYIPVILRQWGVRQPRVVLAIMTTASDIRRYMVVTTVLGLVQGLLDTIALLILQVPAAFLWGVLAFLFSFIPNIGYFFAIFPPLFFGYLVGGWPTVIAVTVIYSVINAVVQSIIQPRVVGKAVSLSQTVTFFSVLFWAIVLGPVGAILSIPLTLLAKSLLVDVDPELAGIRLVFGPTEDTRTLKRSDDAALKAARSRRHEPPPPPADRDAPADDASAVPAP